MQKGKITSRLFTVLAILVLIIIIPVTVFATPVDQDFDDEPLYNSTIMSWTIDGITYTNYGSNCNDILIADSGYIASSIASVSDYALAFMFWDIGVTNEASFKTEDGSEFKLNGFEISTFERVSTITIKGYRDNAEVANSAFDTASSTFFDVSGNAAWENIDEVRMATTDSELYIDDIDFSPAVVPVYTVTYDGNNNTGGSVPIDGNSYSDGDTVTVLGNIGGLYKTGYSFIGWNTESNGSGNWLDGGDTFSMGSTDITLYAMWVANDYSVTYEGNDNTGGSVPTDGNTYNITNTVTVSGNTGSLVKEGYYFTEWNTALDGTGLSYSGGDTFAMGNSDVTLYAQWAEITYSVTYDGNSNTGGAVPIDGTSYKNGDTAIVLGNTGSLVKSGYNFTGWNTAAGGNGFSFSGGDTFSMGSTDVTLYAQWLDNTPPGPPAISSITSDTGAIDSDGITKDQYIMINGTAEINSTVEVYKDSVSIGTSITDTSGNWSFDYSGTALPEGTHVLTADATDDAGNTSVASAGFTLEIDLTPPAPPVILSIESDTGISGNDGITNDSTLIFAGTAEADSYVEIFNGDTYESWGITQTDEEGNWGNSSPRSFVSGEYNVIAVARDLAANQSDGSAAYPFEIETTAPTVLSLNPSDNATEAESGNNLVITFSEAVYAGNGNITIRKYSDDSLVETISAAGSQITGSGTDTITIDPAADLEVDTQYYIQIDANALMDSAGNYYSGIPDKTTWNFTTKMPDYRIIASGTNYEVWTGFSGGAMQGSHASVGEALQSISGADTTIQFGDGSTALTVPTTGSYANILPAGKYTGKVASSGDEQYLFVVKDGAEVFFDNIEILNTSTYYSGGNDSRAVHVTDSGSKLIIDGTGTVIESTNGSWCIYNSGGTVMLSEGTVKSGANYAYAIYNYSGVLNIEGGTVRGDGSYTAIMTRSTVNITGGAVEGIGASNAIMVYAGTTNISGGTVSSVNGNAIKQLGGSSTVNISGTATVISTSSDAIYRTGGTTNITGGMVKSTETNESAILHGNGSLNIGGGAKIAAKSQKEILILSIYSDDTTRVTIDGVTIWNKEDAEISIHGALNDSTGFYEIDGALTGFDVSNAYINASYIRSPYLFGKWATTAARDVAVPDSARKMIIGDNDTFYLAFAVIADYKVEHYMQSTTADGYTLHETDPFTGIAGTTATAVSKAYTGYTINNMHPDRVATGTILEDNSLVLKLYYSINSYDVTFESNGGSNIDPTNANYDSYISAPADPSKAGYDFNGWFKDAGLSEQWNFSTDTVPAKDITLYANWTARDDTPYELEHHLQNLDDDGYTLFRVDTLSGTTDTTVSATAETFTGFNENTTHADRVANSNLPGDGSLILKLYYDRNIYTVTFRDYDGSIIDSQSVKHNGDASAPADPTRTGCTFTGWDKAYDDITADTEITATYDANSYSLTVNYTMSDGSEAPDIYTATVIFNTTYRVVSPQVTGYTPDIQTVAGTMGASDKTVDVSYAPNPDTPYKVEHYQESINGEYIKAETDELTGTTNTAAAATAKTYAGFSENIAHPERAASGNIEADGTTVLRLYYTRKMYTVSFRDWDGATLKTEDVKYEDKASFPANPEREGYIFRGWFEEPEAINGFKGDTPIKRDMTIHAGWSKAAIQEDKIEVVINGKSVLAGIGNMTDKFSMKILIEPDMINNEFDQASGDENRLEVPIPMRDFNKISTALTGDTVREMENSSYVLAIQSNDINYIIPSKEIGIDNIARKLGVEPNRLKDIEIEVNIEFPDSDELDRKIEQAKENGYEPVFPPVSFEITAKTKTPSGEEKQEVISKFNQYVQREIKLPANVDPKKVTTGIIFNEDGTFSHVPTEIFNIDGVYYVRINSLTNSTYTVIWNPVSVDSVEEHWSRDAVNDMASRFVIKDPGTFLPDKEITRGQFAEYITRALGIYGNITSESRIFTDVDGSHEFAAAIEVASEYDIINGYPDGSFKPDASINREEAMTIFARAMDIAGMEETADHDMGRFSDLDEISGWAYNDVEKTVGAGIFKGKTDKTIDPKATLTCAEAVTAIRNLLLEAGLINQ